MANNIIFNLSLQQYNKKYKNRKYRLLKYTKKEVEDFDKNYPSNSKHMLLKNRKWALIGETYYEIPKPIRFTWFRNLNSACQIGTCVLAAGIVATAVTVPLVLLQNKEAIADVTIDESLTGDLKITKVEKDKDGNTVISLENISTEKYPKEVEIHKGEKVLEENVDYVIQIKETNEDIIINKESMDKYNGGIKLKPLYDADFDGEVTENEWKAAFQYLCEIDEETNYSCFYEYEDEENETEKDIIKIDNFSQKLEGKKNSYQKLLSDGSIIQFGDDGLINNLLDKIDQDKYISSKIAEFDVYKDYYGSFTFSAKDKYYYYYDTVYGFNYVFKFKKKGDLVVLDYHAMGESAFVKFINYGTTKVVFTTEIKNFIEYSGTPSEGTYKFDKYTTSEGNDMICYRINLEDVTFEDGKFILMKVPQGGMMAFTTITYVIDEKINSGGTMSDSFYINNSEFMSKKSKTFTFLIKVLLAASFGEYECVLKVNQTKD